MKKAIIIFTRIPVAGETKTRLGNYYTDQECAELHSCFLHDYAEIIDKIDVDVFIIYNGKADINILKNIFEQNRIIAYIEQRGENIGEKMSNAFLDVFSREYDSVILLGSDVPSVSENDLIEAFKNLQSNDMIIAGVEDGGYYLIGMNEIHDEIFCIDKYGNEKVLDKTLAVMKKERMSFALLDEKFDVDLEKDLVKFEEEVERKPENYACSNTYKYIINHRKISVIIPIYNEIKEMKKLFELIESLKECLEIILVDGGSVDGTYEYIEKNLINKNLHVRLCKSSKGRSRQMNYAASIARGQILMFLHADSKISSDYYSKTVESMKKGDLACFTIEFDSNKLLMKINSICSNFRSKYRKIIFGDQGIIVRKQIFDEIGGFKDIPIMEDYQFSLDAKKAKLKSLVIKSIIRTSSRRYSNNSYKILKTMYSMLKLRKMYRNEVPIDVINKMYKDVR